MALLLKPARFGSGRGWLNRRSGEYHVVHIFMEPQSGLQPSLVAEFAKNSEDAFEWLNSGESNYKKHETIACTRGDRRP
jgi:hypothetical protein